MVQAMKYIAATDARGQEVKLPLTSRALEFFKTVNPAELPERCPHCKFQSIEQGRTFSFATIVVQKAGHQEMMVDGFECSKCGRRIDIAHCDLKLGGEK